MEWGTVNIKENEMYIIASITTSPVGLVAAGDIVGAFSNYATRDLRGKAVVEKIGNLYLCLFAIYYDTDEIGNSFDLKLYRINTDTTLSSYITIREGIVGSKEDPEQLLFSDAGGGHLMVVDHKRNE